MLKVTTIVGRLEEVEAPLITTLVAEDKELTPQLQEIDNRLSKGITKALSLEEFKGRLYESFTVYTAGRLKADYLLLVGIGQRSELTGEAFRIASAEAARRASSMGLSRYAIHLDEKLFDQGNKDAVGAIVEGAELALYTFSRYKAQSNKNGVEEALLVLDSSEQTRLVEEAVEATQKVCEAVKLARDIANTPSSDMTPSMLAEEARRVAERNSLECTILGLQEVKQMGMNGILNVSKGSGEEPKVVILSFRGGREEDKPIILVGKGVTFDSGGISIKPSEKMEDMKYDKSGAAAVIAAIQAAAQLKLPQNIVAIAPLVENMPSGTAYKPGDVIRHYGGKTSEVISTDAEGRLILADVLAYASEKGAQAIIDLATLTGACVIALGSQAAGLFGNNEALIGRVVKAAEASGERVWRMPLWKEYFDQIKSEVADIKNSGGRAAGAITAAAFLSSLVGKTPWVHLDIAGTAYTADDGTKIKPYTPKGATGFGVRLLIKLLREWSPLPA